jgi:hypothetical protein
MLGDGEFGGVSPPIEGAINVCVQRLAGLQSYALAAHSPDLKNIQPSNYIFLHNYLRGIILDLLVDQHAFLNYQGLF